MIVLLILSSGAHLLDKPTKQDIEDVKIQFATNMLETLQDSDVRQLGDIYPSAGPLALNSFAVLFLVVVFFLILCYCIF
jgi:hypothetical protein